MANINSNVSIITLNVNELHPSTFQFKNKDYQMGLRSMLLYGAYK